MVFEGSRGAHVEGEEMKQNEMFVRTKEEVKESARTDRLKKKGRGTGFRRVISELRTSGFGRSGRLVFHSQKFGGVGGWDTKTAESQVIPQLKGLWVETLRRVLAFTHCWGNGGVCQMSAPYP